MLGEDFSESELFYDIMHKSFDDVADIVIEGKVMKNKGVSAEPDFYMRIGRHSIYLRIQRQYNK